MSMQSLVVAVALLLPPIPDPRKNRCPEALRRLAHDLREHGQRHEIGCRPEGERYRVIAGESRRQALIMAGIKEVRIRLINRPLTEAEILMEQFSENEYRQNFTPIERAELFQQMLKTNGWTIEQLAKAIQIAPGTISKSLSIQKLPLDLQQLISQGTLPITVGTALARLTDPEAMRLLVGDYQEGRLTRDGVEARVKRLQVRTQKPPRPVVVKIPHMEVKLPWLPPQQLVDSLMEIINGLKRMEKLGLDLHSLKSLLKRDASNPKEGTC